MGYLIFGATGGVGSELTRRLTERGEKVFLAARDSVKLEKLADSCGAFFESADITDSAQVERVFAVAREKLGQIEGAACCVGSLLLKPAHLTQDREFEQTLRVNLFGAFYVLREAVRAMSEAGGSLVLLSSAAARIGIANHEAISAAKAGVQGLALAAAATYAAKNIRVNVVAPGMIETPLTETILRSASARKMSEGMHALKRIGKPADAASLIAWLLDRENSWVTGQVFGVDGGLGTVVPRLDSSARS